jgi:hypothetical protein
MLACWVLRHRAGEAAVRAQVPEQPLKRFLLAL